MTDLAISNLCLDEGTETSKHQLITSLANLGHQLCAWSFEKSESSENLVIALTVPNRELVSWLIAVGWLGCQIPDLSHRKFRGPEGLDEGDTVRFLTKLEAIQGRFNKLERKATGDRITVAGLTFLLKNVEAFAPIKNWNEKYQLLIDDATVFRHPRCELGVFSRWAGIERSEVAWNLVPPANVVIFGSKKQLVEEAEIKIREVSTPRSKALTLGQQCNLRSDDHFGWGVDVRSSSRVAELSDAPDTLRKRSLVILDGLSAVNQIGWSRGKVTVCIVDRKRMSEDFFQGLSEFQVKEHYELAPVSEFLDWAVPIGVEAVLMKGGLR